jgi:hypothetical protein
MTQYRFPRIFRSGYARYPWVTMKGEERVCDDNGEDIGIS